MIVIMKKGVKMDDVEHIRNTILSRYNIEVISRYGKIILRILDSVNEGFILKKLNNTYIVDKIIKNEAPYFLVTREFKSQDTFISIGDIVIGGKAPTVIAGPCAVEAHDQIKTIAYFLRNHGIRLLRGGAYKPRTSTYSFQGLEITGLKILRNIANELGMYVVTEAVDTDSFGYVEKYADIIQIGARNMQNFSLLKRAGRAKKPIILKRGFMSTIDEFLSAAEYIVFHGNPNVILCERGIRTYERLTRFTLDISAIPVLKELTHLPICVDPSHAAGKRSLVIPLARAAIAAGADGIMVEVHNDPDMALSDGKQSLTFEMFETLISQLYSGVSSYREKKIWTFMQPSFS